MSEAKLCGVRKLEDIWTAYRSGRFSFREAVDAACGASVLKKMRNEACEEELTWARKYMQDLLHPVLSELADTAAECGVGLGILDSAAARENLEQLLNLDVRSLYQSVAPDHLAGIAEAAKNAMVFAGMILLEAGQLEAAEVEG